MIDLGSLDANVILTHDLSLNVVTDSEEEQEPMQSKVDLGSVKSQAHAIKGPHGNQQSIHFDVDDILEEGQEIEEQIYPGLSKTQQELLHWHYCLDHLSFAQIQEMAKQGILPSRLAKCSIPFCSGYAYGKMTRKSWRTKAPYASTPKFATQPGQCI
jgi:hypothetical protein